MRQYSSKPCFTWISGSILPTDMLGSTTTSCGSKAFILSHCTGKTLCILHSILISRLSSLCMCSDCTFLVGLSDFRSGVVTQSETVKTSSDFPKWIQPQLLTNSHDNDSTKASCIDSISEHWILYWRLIAKCMPFWIIWGILNTSTRSSSIVCLSVDAIVNVALSDKFTRRSNIRPSQSM